MERIFGLKREVGYLGKEQPRQEEDELDRERLKSLPVFEIPNETKIPTDSKITEDNTTVSIAVPSNLQESVDSEESSRRRIPSKPKIISVFAPARSTPEDNSDHISDELNLSREQTRVLQVFSRSSSSRSLSATFKKDHPLTPRPVICIEEPGEDEDLAATNPTSFKVRFSTITIREYLIELGDNPAAVRGIPLTIGWDYDRSYTLNLDEFEQVRPPKRLLSELKTESLDRLRILRAMGYSREELQQRTKEVNITRERRLRTKEFHRLAHVEVLLERMQRSILNATLRRRQKRHERELLSRFRMTLTSKSTTTSSTVNMTGCVSTRSSYCG